MPSQPQNQASDSKRLPFEPSKNKKKPEKSKTPSTPAAKSPSKEATSKGKPSKSRKTQSLASGGIPEAVSKRMIRRMAIFCGVPTALGISSFFVSYLVVTNELFELPNTAVLFVSLGFFGLGVLGLSYGALSSSWDEATPGGLIGFGEFRLNLGRMQQAWKEAREQSQSR